MNSTSSTHFFSPLTAVASAALLCAASLSAVPALAQTAASPTSTAAAPAERKVITSADQLPRRTYTLAQLPSAYLSAPLASLKPLGAQLEADIQADLAAYDIKDAATLREAYGALASLAQLRGDWAAVPGWTAKARALQEKPAGKQTSGVLTDLLAQQQLEKRDAAWLSAEVARRYGAMNWAEVQDTLKANRGGVETFNPELMIGSFKAQLDVMAQNGQMVVPAQLAQAIVSTRMQMELLGPNKAAIVAGLQQVLDANSKTVAKADIWTPRTFSIPADAKAKPVLIGVWDSGVDLTLFKTGAAKGLAFTDEGQASKDLLRPLGEAEPRWPQLRSMIKGAMDQRAALDTPDSRQFRATLGGLKAEQAKGFGEDMALAGLYVHGTHVAGIAVEGNPFAQVYAATMLWSHKTEPSKPSEARSRLTAANYGTLVQGFKSAGVRVVNMSWRYGPSAYEMMMAYHNLGGTPEQRKAEALRLFKIERDALNAAIAGAPEILFVAGSGNEDNSADFEEYIPAGLSLPNLITAGAVDRSGSETSFSTFGKTVVVHANGFEVDAPIPGGVRMKLSGTSMASPQVANLAAKLIALKPELKPTEVKALILQGAERMNGADGKPGRVNLINPRKSAELAGLKL
ncbi:S8 family serine peptidase [Paucibacter sp. Y2R2-4]|uniref:S8 family serine peptidase n=1 Tax=Paucibacter sp. Y2R2-4 TaxID=2893553 RepID=UPI0021E47296|nr:S8 family serine peptidase [Paucibacter sp. Y2R2-4]MCV2350734.1 S8 family serine peptidase [Paucibacter sp. Y2R2-4]